MKIEKEINFTTILLIQFRFMPNNVIRETSLFFQYQDLKFMSIGELGN